MKQIKEENLQKAIEIIDKLTTENIEAFSEKHIVPYPNMMGYLMSSAFEFNDDALLDYLVYYYNIFMEAISLQELTVKAIDDEILDKFHDEYVEILDEYSETSETELIESFCNQPTLLHFLMDEIHSEDADGNDLTDEAKSSLFIIGIALIGVLNTAIEV